MSGSPIEPQGEVSVLNPTQLQGGMDHSSYGGSWMAVEVLCPVLMGCLMYVRPSVLCYRDPRAVGLSTRLQNKKIIPHVTVVTAKL